VQQLVNGFAAITAKIQVVPNYGIFSAVGATMDAGVIVFIH
jgi:hypothetical protein